MLIKIFSSAPSSKQLLNHKTKINVTYSRDDLPRMFQISLFFEKKKQLCALTLLEINTFLKMY